MNSCREPEIIEFLNTVRLIPTRYSNETVLVSLDVDEQVVADLSELDAATNERLLVSDIPDGITVAELVYGVPEAAIINAAFCHPGPNGGRFHDRTRGAWYAGDETKTALAEVTFHRHRMLQDTRAVGDFNFPYRSFLADFQGEYHILTKADSDYLQPEPVPACYAHSQALARQLLRQGSYGIVYPSTRRPDGRAIACFRPALVNHVRRDELITVTVSL